MMGQVKLSLLTATEVIANRVPALGLTPNIAMGTGEKPLALYSTSCKTIGSNFGFLKKYQDQNCLCLATYATCMKGPLENGSDRSSNLIPSMK